MNEFNNKGAISALKGYRVQFLYSLQRILSCNNNESEFRPEGEYEDLDIYNLSGDVIEIIQVKDFANTLTLSKILSSKENSFIRRAIYAYKNGKKPKIKLVSFSAVNNEVKELGQNIYSQKLIGKLKKLQLKEEEIKVLQDNFIYEVVNELQIVKDVLEKLKQWGDFADNKITLDLLIYWIYYAAEKQKCIKPIDFREQFIKIGKYQSERISINRTYNSLIRPLDKVIETENVEVLKSDFYQGISASFKHILADIDVKRIDKLRTISDGFLQSNIVFIHGASGQGKSTLAYRYIHEYCDNQTVYELKKLPEDISTIYEVINALEGISKGIDFPITLYIDVEPGNIEWINILKELATKENFYFLVSIRAEDWNSVEVGDKFQFSEVELMLEKDEANLIYDSLVLFNEDLKFIDFENAWGTFGGEGPLLEFVYLITQNESLSSKLKSQIDKLRSDSSVMGREKVKLLRYIVLADCFGSKVKFKEIGQSLKIHEIGLLIELLQKEYLIKLAGNKSYITGLHPVRSEIIKDLLFDNEIYIESDYALESIFFICDNTFLSFLRNTFRRTNLSPDKLIESLETFNPGSWQSHHLIFKSLLWKGIEDYVNKNISILNRIYDNYQKGWITVVNFDFANAMDGGSIMENSDIFTEEQRQYAKSINEEFSAKNEIYSYCRKWLHQIKQITIVPINRTEWNAFGLFLFWLHHLQKTDLVISFNGFDFDKSLKEQPLDVMSHVLYSLKNFNEQTIQFVESVETSFLQKLSSEYNIISIEKEPDSITCHYLIDIIDEKIDTDENDFVHEKSIKIIDLLRYAFPDKEFYGTNGVGHVASFLPDIPDSSIKKIPKKNLPLKPLVEINSTYLNLFNYTKRPLNWQDYVDSIIARRQLFVEVLRKMVAAFHLYHKRRNLQSLAEYVHDYTENYHNKIKNLAISMFPKSIIDEWGILSEGGRKKNKLNTEESQKPDKERMQVLGLRKYEEFLTLYREFDSSLENFLWQSAESIFRVVKRFLNEDVSEIKDNARISLVGNLYKAYESISEFQRYFKTHFEKFTNLKLLRNIEKLESDCILHLCFLYHHFICTNSFLTGNTSKLAMSRFIETEASFKKKLTNALKTIKKEFGCEINIRFEEENKCCIIVVDIYNSLNSLEVLQKIYDTLFLVLDQPEYTSIKYLIISSKYPIFNIIPLVNGKTINGKWYDFKTYNLREKCFEELSQFNLIPQDIPPDFIKRYNLQAWNQSLDEFHDLDQLLESVAMSYQLAFHFSQLKYFEDKNVEEYNEEIFLKYINKTGRLFQENLQKALDLFGNYAKLCNDEDINFVDNNEKLDFYEMLIENHKNFYPNDKLFEKGEMRFSLGIKEMENWLPRLEELTNNISVIYYFLAGKIIESNMVK